MSGTYEQQKKYAARHRAKHPGKMALQNRKASFKRAYGITIDDYDRMYHDQGGICAICYRVETAQVNGHTRLLCVDHNHLTKKVRGLLCSSCNRAVGYLGDCPLCARSLVQY